MEKRQEGIEVIERQRVRQNVVQCPEPILCPMRGRWSSKGFALEVRIVKQDATCRVLHLYCRRDGLARPMLPPVCPPNRKAGGFAGRDFGRQRPGQCAARSCRPANFYGLCPEVELALKSLELTFLSVFAGIRNGERSAHSTLLVGQVVRAAQVTHCPDNLSGSRNSLRFTTMSSTFSRCGVVIRYFRQRCPSAIELGP